MEIPNGTYVTALDGPYKGWRGRLYTNICVQSTPVYIGVRHDLTVTEGFAGFLRTSNIPGATRTYAELLWKSQHGSDVPDDILVIVSDLTSPLIKLDPPKKHRRGKPHKMRSGV